MRLGFPQAFRRAPKGLRRPLAQQRRHLRLCPAPGRSGLVQQPTALPRDAQQPGVTGVARKALDPSVGLHDAHVAAESGLLDGQEARDLGRAFQWLDGSAFIQHVKLVRKARNAEPPETLMTVPLMYQGSGDDFLAPNADIPLLDDSHGVDFEGEYRQYAFSDLRRLGQAKRKKK